MINTGVGVRAGMSQEAYDGFLAHMRSRIPAGRVSTFALVYRSVVVRDPAGVPCADELSHPLAGRQLRDGEADSTGGAGDDGYLLLIVGDCQHRVTRALSPPCDSRGDIADRDIEEQRTVAVTQVVQCGDQARAQLL